MTDASKAFDMGRMAIGGLGQMLDSVELVKRAWSTLNIPNTLVPTVDVDELDKRIADLKAVEQWLNVNLGMLRGTIQGMEIQRGTLVAVKAFSSTLGNLSTPPAPDASPRSAARKAAAPPPEADAANADEAPAREAPKARRKPGPDADAKPEIPPSMLPGINPSAWWNLLQQNFNQVAEAALSGVGLQGVADGTGAGAAPTDARRPTTRTGASRKRPTAKRPRSAPGAE